MQNQMFVDSTLRAYEPLRASADTPRTDAQPFWMVFEDGASLNAVDINFSRTLERELAEALERECHHGWRGSVPDQGKHISTPCPECGGPLFIGSGGHLTCTRVPNDWNNGCPEPGVERSIAKLKERAESAELRLAEREKELAAERKDGERIRDGLRWYADRQHYELPDWEDCSGESSNWLFPPELENQWMVDNGGVARSILDHGHSINPDREADNITIPPQVAALSAAMKGAGQA